MSTIKREKIDPIEFKVVPGMVRLLEGDTVQLDGGPHMVVRSTHSGADCEPLQKTTTTISPRFGEPKSVSRYGRIQHISGYLPKHLVLHRGGDRALEEYSAGKKAPNNMNDMVTLEPGDRLCHGHELRTVVQVGDRSAVLANEAGQRFREKRAVNKFLFTDCKTSAYVRLDEAQRAEHLKDFLARVPHAAGDQQPTSGEESEDIDMARKPKAAKAEKTIKATRIAVEKPARGATDEQVLAFVKEQRKADPEVAPAALIKAFRATGASCSNERMARLAKG